MNEILREIPLELRSTLYSAFGGVMHLVMIVFLLSLLRRSKFNRRESVVTVLIFYVAFFLANSLCSFLGDLTDGLIPRINLGVAFLLFIICVVILTQATKILTFSFLDIAVPIYILGRGVGIIGCLFAGCCHGFSVEWGIYSNAAKTTVVPTVLMDMVMSYIIVVYLMLAGKKQHVSGMTAAKGMLLFGILRYVIDVLRDNEKLISMITVEGICGILYALAGLILLYALSEKRVKAVKNLEFSV